MKRPTRVLCIALAGLAGCKFPYPPDVNDDGRLGDARSLDAPGGRTGPLIQNGQAADLVLGQPSFETNTDRGISAQSFQPEGIAFASGRLWVAEFFRHRVLGWDTPSTSNQAATYLLGQTDFTVGSGGSPSATSLFQVTGVVATGQKVAVLDGFSRVMVWNHLPTMRGQPADIVLGASNFTDQGTLSNLIAGWSDGVRLIVRRGFIRARIVIWSSYPTTSGVIQDLELLTGFEATARDFGPGGGMYSDGTRLVVADSLNHRVLIWNTLPSASGQPADVVIGQPTFTSNATGNSASSMSSPAGVLIVDGALLVADSGNDRVLVFDPLPTVSGAAATQVLGQASPAGALVDQPPAANTLNGPVAMTREGRHLFVSDRSNRRILRYELALP